MINTKYCIEREIDYMENTKRINIAIDEDLHKELKIAAAVNGITVKEYVAKAIQDKLKKEKAKERK